KGEAFLLPLKREVGRDLGRFFQTAKLIRYLRFNRVIGDIVFKFCRSGCLEGFLTNDINAIEAPRTKREIFHVR
ncbi:MAG: hypothetical protein C0407_14560, partial [Desulfobacca sp.]|nr:hypothetical protein [Desulfobacca sp.]